jgi:capsular polysaccharide biosynthesis protein
MYMSVRNNVSSFVRAWGKIFLITLFFVCAASALFFLDMFRSYEADVRIMVISRSASVNPEQVAANLAALVGTLPFHDRVVADDILGDPLEGYPQPDRRARWNDAVRAERGIGNSVITVTAAGEDPEEARQLAARVSKTLFGMAGLYYDVKADIDVRAIDGPIAETVVRQPIAYAATSFLSALLVTMVFFGALIMVPNMFGRSRKGHVVESTHEGAHHQVVTEYREGDAVPYIDPRKFIPVRPSSLPFENAYPETHAVSTPSVKAAAPANLPIADDAIDLPVSDQPLPFTFEGTDLSEYPVADLPFRGEHEVNAEETPEAIMGGEEFHTHEAEERGEPTVEEYKRRLNELLSGGK